MKLVRYRFNDLGSQVVDVDNWQSRFLGGLRGEWRGFDWESALLYSGGRGDRQLQRRESDRASGQSGPVDAGPTSIQRRVRERHQLWRLHAQFQAAIDAITHRSDAGVQDHPGPVGLQGQPARRLLTLPGGPVGMALGVEARRETPARRPRRRSGRDQHIPRQRVGRGQPVQHRRRQLQPRHLWQARGLFGLCRVRRAGCLARDERPSGAQSGSAAGRPLRALFGLRRRRQAQDRHGVGRDRGGSDPGLLFRRLPRAEPGTDERGPVRSPVDQ